jgi:DNA processing protein
MSSYGKTIAVVANGLAFSDIYPKENVKLAEQIIEKGGALVSEYIVGTKSQKYYFPMRNRIVSGLANKILVVEANEKSGTLITVRAWT